MVNAPEGLNQVISMSFNWGVFADDIKCKWQHFSIQHFHAWASA